MTGAGNTRVSAVVLAAGRSARMGTAKQLLRLGSGTVLEQTLANLRESALGEIVLVLGSSAGSIRLQLPDSVLEGVRIVTNEAYEQGMAGSLRVGISTVSPEADAALVVLADQPFVRPETFNRIVEEYSRSHAQIVIPIHGGFRGNPVLLDRSVFHEVTALEGDIGCRAIFGSHLDGIVKVEVEDPGILLDIDNRDDYERLRHFSPGQAESPANEGAVGQAGETPKWSEASETYPGDE